MNADGRLGIHEEHEGTRRKAIYKEARKPGTKARGTNPVPGFLINSFLWPLRAHSCPSWIPKPFICVYLRSSAVSKVRSHAVTGGRSLQISCGGRRCMREW